jgi:hypothetical protein
MSEWQQGAKYMRDNIICTLIGLQNDNIVNMDGDVYRTLQKVLEIIENNHGEYAQPVK